MHQGAVAGGCGEQIHQHQRQPDQQRAEGGPPPQGDAGQAQQQQIFRSSGPIQATENRQRIAAQMVEHPRCSLGAFAIPEQWIEPTAEHQQPADAEAPRRQAPPPTPPARKIDGHACCDQHQAIAAAQHQQQQAKPEPGAAVALGPEG